MELLEVIAFAVKNQATDIHFVPGMPPQMTFSGELRRVNVPALSSDEIGRLLAPHVNPALLGDLQAGRDADFRFEIPRLAAVTGHVTAGTVVLRLPGREALATAKAAAASDDRHGTRSAPPSTGNPSFLISLALLGIALAGAGFAKIALGVDVIPEAWRFDNYEIVFAVTGVVLIVPAVVARKHAGD
jgi:hypothetical protein